MIVLHDYAYKGFEFSENHLKKQLSNLTKNKISQLKAAIYEQSHIDNLENKKKFPIGQFLN